MAIRAEDTNNLPLNNAVGTVVQGTDTRNVDTVFVGGQGTQMVRRAGRGGHRAGSRLAYESQDYLAARAGFSVDPVTAPARREIQDPYLRGYFASHERQ